MSYSLRYLASVSTGLYTAREMIMKQFTFSVVMTIVSEEKEIFKIEAEDLEEAEKLLSDKVYNHEDVDDYEILGHKEIDIEEIQYKDPNQLDIDDFLEGKLNPLQNKPLPL